MTEREINPKILELIDDFFSYHEDEVGSSGKTAYRYRLELIYLFDILEKEILKSKSRDYDIEDISLTNMRNLLKYFRRTANNSKKTISRKISTLKSFYNYLELYHYENDPKFLNIMRKIRLPRLKIHEPKVPTMDDAKEFFNYLNRREFRRSMDKKNYLLAFHLCFCTMARIGELPRIKVKHIDLKRKRILLIGKGDKERVEILDNRTAELIDDYIKSENLSYEDYLIRALGKTSISERTLSHRMRTILDEINEEAKQNGQRTKDFSWMTSHKMLRKCPATELKRKGYDITEIQVLLGHTDIKTTRRYVSSDIDGLEASFRREHPLESIW